MKWSIGWVIQVICMHCMYMGCINILSSQILLTEKCILCPTSRTCQTWVIAKWMSEMTMMDEPEWQYEYHSTGNKYKGETLKPISHLSLRWKGSWHQGKDYSERIQSNFQARCTAPWKTDPTGPCHGSPTPHPPSYLIGQLSLKCKVSALDLC